MTESGLDRMDWSNEITLRFLDLYRLHPCLWDPKNEAHRNKSRVNAAWMDIKNNLGVPISIKELKRKKESLMAAYRGYRSKIKLSELTGSVLYKPSWFAFEHMDAFLRRVYKVNRTFTIKNKKHESEETRDPIEIEIPRERNPLPSHATRKVKRQYKIGDLHQAKERMDQAFSMLKSLSKQSVNEDECHIFGKLIAEKLRRLPEKRRDLMMIKISKLFYKECSEYRPRSSSSIRTYLHYDTPSPVSPSPKIEREDLSISEMPSDGESNGDVDDADAPNDVVTVFENSKDSNHFIIFKK